MADVPAASRSGRFPGFPLGPLVGGGTPSGHRVLGTPSRALRLTEKWALHRRDPVSWGWGDFGGETPEVVLRIHHGSSPIFVRDLGKCIMVLGVIDLPDELRAWFRAATPTEANGFFAGLREVLMSCPRLGFSFSPNGPEGAEPPDRVGLDQTLQVSENDAASFNRFCDAVQETETVLLRVSEYVRSALVRVNERPVYSSNLPPPRDLYL